MPWVGVRGHVDGAKQARDSDVLRQLEVVGLIHRVARSPVQTAPMLVPPELSTAAPNLAQTGRDEAGASSGRRDPAESS
jgi:hypothetical protein